MRPTGTPEELQRRRWRAIELLRQGYAPVEVARMVGADRRSVRRWNAVYRQRGRAALKAQPAPGRPAKLPPARLRTLERRLLRGAKAAGFPTDLWTCPRVAQLIAQRFAVHYHVDHISRVLHALGWSPQKPVRRAMERDEEQIRRWIQQTWPAIKKKRAG